MTTKEALQYHPFRISHYITPLAIETAQIYDTYSDENKQRIGGRLYSQIMKKLITDKLTRTNNTEKHNRRWRDYQIGLIITASQWFAENGKIYHIDPELSQRYLALNVDKVNPQKLNAPTKDCYLHWGHIEEMKHDGKYIDGCYIHTQKDEEIIEIIATTYDNTLSKRAVPPLEYLHREPHYSLLIFTDKATIGNTLRSYKNSTATPMADMPEFMTWEAQIRNVCNIAFNAIQNTKTMRAINLHEKTI